ncbi:MAG: EamA family transporter [Planctomycetia bacterium]
MTPYLQLAGAAVALGMLGVFHKVADHRRCRPEAVNFFLFLFAGLLMAAWSVARSGLAQLIFLPRVALLTAAVCGLLASLAILFFQRGIRYGKISTSWLVINLSTIVPTVLSIVLYREAVSPRRALALGLSLVALTLLWLDRRQQEAEEA